MVLNRVDVVRDELIDRLTVRDADVAQKWYSAMEMSNKTFIDQLGGPEVAGFALARRADGLCRDGIMTEEERRSVAALMHDWPETPVVDVLATIVVVTKLGRFR